MNFLKKYKAKDSLYDVYMFTVFIFLTIGLIVLFEGKILISLLALTTLVMVSIGNKVDNKLTNILANIIFVLIFVWLINRVLLTESRGLVIFNRQTLFDFLVVSYLMLFSLINKVRFIKFSYGLLLGQILIFAILWRDIASISYNILLLVYILVASINKFIALKIDEKLLKLSTNIIMFILSVIILFRLIGIIIFKIMNFDFFSFTPFLNLITLQEILFIIISLTISAISNNKKITIAYHSISVVLIFAFLFKELAFLSYNYVLITWFFLLGMLLILSTKYSYLKYLANFFFIILTSWIGGRILLQNSPNFLLNINSIINLSFIIFIFLMANIISNIKKESYFIVANFLLFVFLFRELYHFGYLVTIIVLFLETIIIYFLALWKKMNYLKWQSYFMLFFLCVVIMTRILFF